MSDQNLGTPAATGSGPKEINKKATSSLIGGILGLTLCGVILGIAAIIVGKQAQAEIAASGGLQGGENRAKWGIILGWVSVALTVIASIIVVITYVGA